MLSIPSLNVVDLLLDAVCMVQADSRIVFVSPAFERIFGYAPAEVMGRRMLEMVHPDDLNATQSQAQNIMEGDLQLQFENRYVRKDGSIAHISWTARWLPDRQLRLAVAHDITERKLNETKQAAIYAISEAAHTAKSLESLYERIHQTIAQLLRATHFSVVLYDKPSNTLCYAYHANTQLTAPGTMALEDDALCAEVVRTGRTILLTPANCHSLPAPQGDALYWLGVPLRTASGTLGLLVLQSYTEQRSYTEKDQELLQFISTQVAAAIERKQMHERLLHMAQHDMLTHLPNRTLLLDRLHTALARARRDGTMVSLLFVDLDRFKRVNDSLGHAMGDQLLQQVARRLQACVRAADTVARLGGDEFVLLLENGHTPRHAAKVASKILESFKQPFTLQDEPQHMQTSIGVAVYPEHGSTAYELLNHADRTMYRSKHNGGNQVQTETAPDLPARFSA